ncbi:FAD-binding domain-containing protein [Thozetella sp. PMI_491]|nr:FAD-binding domain-containing protein [Thozetella sp. PMI_491]
MALQKFIEALPSLSLSSETKLLTDATAVEFEGALARWSDLDKQEPGAIIFPTNEADTHVIVKAALASSVPFVAKAGGHSSWSTIGSDGFILDFSNFRGVTIDAEKSTATASAGTLIGDINRTVSENGFLVATGTVNSVGFIPSTIGGGLTILAPVIGYGSDNIVSARLITAKGDLIEVSETENSELLPAVKGAGQFFGVVTSLTVKIYPLSLFGLDNPDGIIWHATLVFDISKAREVAEAALDINKNGNKAYCLAGALEGPAILAIVAYLGRKDEGEKVFKKLLDVGPIAVPANAEVPIGDLNQAFAAFEAKGGYRRWFAAGVPRVEQFTPEDMQYLVDQKLKIDKEYPAATRTGFVIEFTSSGPYSHVNEDKETAFSHRDLSMFVHLLTDASDEASLTGAAQIAEETMGHIRRRQMKDEYSFYQNFSRVAPIEERYRGAGMREKLKTLKQKWDPEGIFTKQLL